MVFMNGLVLATPKRGKRAPPAFLAKAGAGIFPGPFPLQTLEGALNPKGSMSAAMSCLLPARLGSAINHAPRPSVCLSSALLPTVREAGAWQVPHFSPCRSRAMTGWGSYFSLSTF